MSEDLTAEANTLKNDSLSSHFETLYRTHKLGGASPSTLRQYRASIRNFEKYLIATAAENGIPKDRLPTYARISDLTDSNVHLAGHWLQITKNRSAYTALKLQENLLAIWRFLARKGITGWPEVKKVDVPELIPVIHSEAQLQILFQGLSQLRGSVGDIPAHLYWSGLYGLLYDTMERVWATLCFDWNDYQADTRWIISRARNRKGKRKDMAFKVSDWTASILAQFPGPRKGKILPLPFCVGTLYRKNKQILDSLGLPSDRDHMFHAMRRTAATYFEMRGGDSTKHLGHKDRRTTIEHYLNPTAFPQIHPCDLLPLHTPEAKSSQSRTDDGGFPPAAA